MIKFRSEDGAQFKGIQEMYMDIAEGRNISCDLIIKSKEKVEHFCHRDVVAFSSDFLWNCLKNTASGTLPVILLPDVESKVVELIIMYIYLGEVEIPHEMRAGFMDAYRFLELKGVVDDVQVVVKQEEELMIVDDGASMEGFDETWQSDSEEITPQVIGEPQENRVKMTIRGMYERLNERPARELYEVVNNTMFIWEGDQIVKALHSCGFCEAKILIFYRNLGSDNGIVWSQFDLQSHFEGEHQLIYTPGPSSARSRKHDYAEITASESAVKYEKALKKKLQRLYQKLNKMPNEDLDKVIERTELVIDGYKLIKGQHRCGFCGKDICFNYRMNHVRNYLAWTHDGFMKHVIKHHS